MRKTLAKNLDRHIARWPRSSHPLSRGFSVNAKCSLTSRKTHGFVRSPACPWAVTIRTPGMYRAYTSFACGSYMVFFAKTPISLTREYVPKNNCIPVPLLPPYPLDGWILKSCKQIVTNYFMFFNDVPFRLQARTCIISKRAAYTGLTPAWGTSSPKCERTGEDNFHLQPSS